MPKEVIGKDFQYTSNSLKLGQVKFVSLGLHLDLPVIFLNKIKIVEKELF